ncbi:MAG: hypothetical protein IJD43_08255 [Thermoguttaceae bacterium]|nr:hypothetical protein [Thermoguttaceae bacterium]
MRRFLLLLFFALIASPILAFEAPSNAPTDLSDWQSYTVIDGKIYVYGWSGTHILGFRCASEEDARQIASLWPEWCADYEAYYGCSPVVPQEDYIAYRMDPPLLASPIVSECCDGSWVVIFYISQSEVPGTHSGTLSDFWWSSLAFGTWFQTRGCSFIDDLSPDYSSSQFYGYYADAEYADAPDETQGTPPEGLADGCITYYQGAWRYTDEYTGPTGDVAFRGPSLYADTEEDAERCAAQFADFLASYSWPWYGEPAVLPWSEPKVYQCYVIRDGAVSHVFWRVFFQDYTGDRMETVGQYDSAYMQCLNDYGQYGAGTGGYGVISIYGPSATVSASNRGSVELNGSDIAQAESGVSTVKLTSGSNDVTVTQYTVQKVDAEGDTVGTSEVTSEASVSEGSDGSINVTNNTTINTNLELGDAPAADSFITEERQVSSSSDLLTETEPEYTYIVKGGSEDYSIDFETFFEDVKKKISEIFGMEELLTFFEDGVSGSASLEDWHVYFSPSLYFTVPWSSLASHSVVQMARSALSLFMQLTTLFMCFKLMS